MSDSKYEQIFLQTESVYKKIYLEKPMTFQNFYSYVKLTLYDFKNSKKENQKECLDFLKIIKPVCPSLIENLWNNLLEKWKISRELIENGEEYVLCEPYEEYYMAKEILREFGLIGKKCDEPKKNPYLKNQDSIIYHTYDSDSDCESEEDGEDEETPFSQFNTYCKSDEDEDEDDYSDSQIDYFEKIKPLIPEKINNMKQKLLKRWDMFGAYLNDGCELSRDLDRFGDYFYSYKRFRDKCIKYKLIDEIVKLY